MSDINKTLELVVKVLVAAIAGILGLFVLGWIMRGLGGLMLGLGGLLVALLKFIVPVAVIAGIVYFAVSQLRPKESDRADAGRNDAGSGMVTGTVDVEVKVDHHGADASPSVTTSGAPSQPPLNVTGPDVTGPSTTATAAKSPVTIDIDATTKD
jgi:hypothetical protein